MLLTCAWVSEFSSLWAALSLDVAASCRLVCAPGSEPPASLSVSVIDGAARPALARPALGSSANELTSHLAGELCQSALRDLTEREEVRWTEQHDPTSRRCWVPNATNSRSRGAGGLGRRSAIAARGGRRSLGSGEA